MRDLSAKLDVFLQLHRHQKEYPLNLRDWRLTKVLHNSHDCIIYKAIGHQGKPAAIKRFKFNIDQLSPETVDEYLKTIALQCGIFSNGLMDFIEGGVCSNAFYLVMEYLTSGNLRHYLDSRDKVLPLKHALEWFTEIADALAVIHQAGLIHRDLKIGNIMLRDDGSLALTDYGIPKNILLNAGFLAEDEIHGSPYYLSPELISGELCSQSSDIYSLGIIFYELLTGARPYNANNPLDLLMAHILEPIPVLSDDLRFFQVCLEQMLAKNPDDRFSNMTDLLQSFVLSYEAYKDFNLLKKTPPHLSYGFSSGIK